MTKRIFLVSSFLFLVSFVLFLFRHHLPPQHQLEVMVDEIKAEPTQILESGLPDKHLLKTVFVPQAPQKNWDQPWQDACEEAALLNAHYFYQQKQASIAEMVADLNQLFNYQQQQGWGHDVNLTQIANMAAELWGYQTQIIDHPTLEDIKKAVSQNIPIIIPANGKILFTENKNFKNGGPWYHNLTILGYDDNKEKFTVHDVGTRLGAYFQYSYSLLMDSIHDLPATGHKEDINQGVPRVLLLLK